MVQQQSNSHEGGSLTDMAPNGTSIPNTAGKQNIIASIPRPDQRIESYVCYGGLPQPTSAMAADNTTEMPRSISDRGETGEVMTGTGDSMPAGVESKLPYIGKDIPRRSGESNGSESETGEGADHKVGVHQFFGLESSY
ncbi:hypothetical protein N7490_002823 [Penicillium lividum]|nr:hypothetical protein N7490_002823 [Penicillium lividum]